ncbi:MAG TPA: glycosyltransferase family 4 protein [Syntrophales bacterium]|nr:glycosyltransferase family 4 protein [Syntrophales bacterium]
MNVLLINHYAGSPDLGMEFRPYYLAREWVRRGHEVTIAAASFSHVRTKNPKVPSAGKESWVDGIRYLWLSTPRYGGNDMRRVRNMGAFIFRLFFHHGKILRLVRPDVVIASSTYPLDIFPAWLMARRAGARLVFEVHDLWPLSPVELGGMSPRHPFILVMQGAEDFAYRAADRVVSMLPEARAHMERHGMARDKFVYIPNGVDLEEWRNHSVKIPETHEAVFSELRRQKGLIVGYAGAHGLANNLNTLLEAAEILKRGPFWFVLAGQGPEKEALRQRARSIGLERVVFLPTVPRKAVPDLLSRMDLLYIGLRPEPLFRFGISPNKLMDYMMAGKPVLSAIEAGNDPVGESGCGLTVAPGDAPALAGSLKALAALSPAAREKMGEKGRRYVTARHDYGVLAERFLRVLENKAGSLPGAGDAGRAAAGKRTVQADFSRERQGS